MKLSYLVVLLWIPIVLQAQKPMKLIDYVQQGNIEQVKALITNANVNTQNQQQENLVLIAARNNDLPMAELLIAHGANPNQQDRIKDSAFLYTGVSGNAAMAKLFLANGARFDLYNRYNGTALIPAAERGHIELVRLLANTPGFPVNHVNRLGWTALLEAVILGDGSQKYVEIVDILLKAGANKHDKDNEGVSVLQHAQKRGYTPIVRLLQAK